jgi:hypothetical protein
MSRQFLTSLNLNKNELLLARIQNLATAPSSPVTGQIYFDTTLGALRQFDGTVWKTYTKSGDIVNGDIAANAEIDITKLNTDVLARANHTGTQPASTISDFDTQVRTNRLDQLSAPTTSVNLNDQRLTAVASPVDSADAANKQYVDDAIAGLTWKESVHLLSVVNVPLTGASGTLVIDGHAALDAADDGYRLLLTTQTNTLENGIYVYTDNGTTYSLSRPTDADAFGELIGATVFVKEGDLYGSSAWTQAEHYLTSFDNQEWVQFSGAAQITAGNGLVKDGNLIHVVGTADRITANADSIDIASTYVGQDSITTVGTVVFGVWEASDVGVAHGGTGASDAAGAKTNLGFMTRYAASNELLVPSSGIVSWAVTHSLGTKDVTVQVYDLATDAEVEVDVVRTSTSVVTLSWVASANVAADSYRVVIVG